LKGKDNSMLNMDSKAPWKTGPQRKPAMPASPQPFLRIGGHALSLASDIGALEECLALERSNRSDRPLDGTEGIQSPPAVPYCEFLTVRSLDGRLEAVCRLMRLDREIPLGHPLKSGRFRLSPLITAIRYSREGILEMGSIDYAPGHDRKSLAGLIWTGALRFMERNGLGFVIGREILASGSGDAGDASALMEAYGLHPDLEVDPVASSRARARTAPSHARAVSVRPDPTRKWPAGLEEGLRLQEGLEEGLEEGLQEGLQEALRRGCRLACEPTFNPATGGSEWIWVASREMLLEGGPGDWRGG
jgi:hypothetical protein